MCLMALVTLVVDFSLSDETVTFSLLDYLLLSSSSVLLLSGCMGGGIVDLLEKNLLPSSNFKYFKIIIAMSSHACFDGASSSRVPLASK